MLKKTLGLVGLTLSISANAAIVSYNGYILDTDTNIVRDGGLEWLQWDETIGQSINTALSNYMSDGWRLATNSEMATLFNSFNFGLVFSDEEWHGSAEEWRGQEPRLYDPLYSFSSANKFIELFGDTYLAAGREYNFGDKYEASSAWYGSDTDQDGYFKWAEVEDEHHSLDYRYISGKATLSQDRFLKTASGSASGVALVRVSAVPIPVAAWLFGSALIGLVGFKRNKYD